MWLLLLISLGWLVLKIMALSFIGRLRIGYIQPISMRLLPIQALVCELLRDLKHGQIIDSVRIYR